MILYDKKKIYVYAAATLEVLRRVLRSNSTLYASLTKHAEWYRIIAEITYSTYCTTRICDFRSVVNIKTDAILGTQKTDKNLNYNLFNLSLEENYDANQTPQTGCQ